MPARVVLVHDDAAFLDAFASRLQQAGYEVAAYSNAITAYDVLKGATRIEVLVTRVVFPPNQPHGGALAVVAGLRRPSLKTIILTQPEVADRVHIGDYRFSMPVEPDEVVQAVETLLTPVADQQTTPK
ncbi:MAG: hypothetical protein ACJ8AW_03040 [Rhodopila sp.]